MAVSDPKAESQPPVPRNIVGEQLAAPDWRNGRFVSLDSIYNSLLEKSLEVQRWYMKRKDSRKHFAIWLRWIAILAALLGAAYPVLLLADIKMLKANPAWGYLAFACSAFCIGADKLLCMSSGSRRYVRTALALEKEHSAFQLAWSELLAHTHNQLDDDEDVARAFSLFKRFSNIMHGLMVDETDAFFADFEQASLVIEKTVSVTKAEQHQQVEIARASVSVPKGEGTKENNGSSLKDTVIRKGRQDRVKNIAKA